MSDFVCIYQRTVEVADLAEALSKAQCQHCGISAMELILTGELLEICGETLAPGRMNGGRVVKPIALCPECHRAHHLSAVEIPLLRKQGR
jgi:hypothetical protein